jgi:hypothetical protein
MVEAQEIPEFVLDQRGDEVRVGDTIAYAVLLSRSASLSIGTVLGFQYTKTQWDPELKVKVQGFEPWSSYSDRNGDGQTLKKPGFLHAGFRRFVKIDPKEHNDPVPAAP